MHPPTSLFATLPCQACALPPLPLIPETLPLLLVSPSRPLQDFDVVMFFSLVVLSLADQQHADKHCRHQRNQLQILQFMSLPSGQALFSLTARVLNKYDWFLLLLLFYVVLLLRWGAGGGCCFAVAIAGWVCCWGRGGGLAI